MTCLEQVADLKFVEFKYKFILCFCRTREFIGRQRSMAIQLSDIQVISLNIISIQSGSCGSFNADEVCAVLPTLLQRLGKHRIKNHGTCPAMASVCRFEMALTTTKEILTLNNWQPVGVLDVIGNARKWRLTKRWPVVCYCQSSTMRYISCKKQIPARMTVCFWLRWVGCTQMTKRKQSLMQQSSDG